MDALQWVHDPKIVHKFCKYMHSCIFLRRGFIAFIRPSKSSQTEKIRKSQYE